MAAPRSRHTALRAAVAAALAVAVIAAGQSSAPSAGDHRAHAAPAAIVAEQQTPEFLEPFTGFPSVPTPWHPSNWGVHVQSRNSDTWTALETMTGPDAMHHGTDCGAPPATHDSQTPGMAYEEAVFQCRDHVMTSIHAGGYGLIYLTPPAQADFSQGETVISVDTSTFQSSDRDWQDIWIQPLEDNLINPFPAAAGTVDLQGIPRRGIHINQSNTSNGVAWRGARTENFIETGFSGNHCCLGYNQFLDPSRERRSKLEIRLSTTHIKISMVANCQKTINGVLTDTQCKTPSGFSAVWLDQAISPPLDWTKGVVQFGHHSYNPWKSCQDAQPKKPNSECPADTWHWDNVRIAPYEPMTLINAIPRQVTQATQDVTFGSPAPADAHVRFAAIGSVETSFDGGQTWTARTKQPASHPRADLSGSYWVPIPQGTTSMRVRLSNDQTYAGPFRAYDFQILAAGAQAPTPTATPVPPTDTPTPVPTDTPTPVPTDTPTPTATATPVPPTSTPTPTATPETITVDNVNATLAGAWTLSTTNPGYWSVNYAHDGAGGKGTKTARFTPAFTQSANYRVLVRHSAATNRANNVPVTIRHAGVNTLVSLDQTQNNNTWVDLGTYPFVADGDEYVEYANVGTAFNSYVMLDVVRWEPVP